MKLKKQQKSVFVQPLTWVSLSILIGSSISPLVNAQSFDQKDERRYIRCLERQSRNNQEIHCKRPAPEYPLSSSPLRYSEQQSYFNCLERQARRHKKLNCTRPIPQPQPPQKQQTQPDERTQLIQEANSFYNSGNYPLAEDKFRKLVKMYPKDAYIHYQLGNTLYREAKPEAAIDEYQEAIRLNSDYAVAHNAIGMIRASQDNWDEAINEYQKALNINPKYGDALKNLGEALWHQGKSSEAIAALEKARNVFKEQDDNDKIKSIDQLLEQVKHSRNN
ncbi:tetratricopeptide repeat protein [Nostoc sp. CENA67]|uniref:Tetratricopeptide repeat protein n=1 Tax=Amazonocrinis nigriterrae CENA67 TaxID=2794033 RepID=A0A8J7HXR4_9NOST|nr:tetratricopeptide repeat protein [Amazonocrinis nigriterrae]MBH8564339.1 tetratricopeptide repeat protein [Amazonocrinis nigriterrae CENA67]